MEPDLAIIANELNVKAEQHKIGHLQEIRQRLKGLARLPQPHIFHSRTIFADDGYAYHDGGRKELQFNIGFEDDQFRFGVAFSFEPSRTLPDVTELAPKVDLFNAYLAA